MDHSTVDNFILSWALSGASKSHTHTHTHTPSCPRMDQLVFLTFRGVHNVCRIHMSFVLKILGPPFPVNRLCR